MALLFSDGNRIPEFLLPRMGGEIMRFPDIELKPTLFFLWAPWHPCAESLPEVQEFYKINSIRTNVIGISFDIRGHAQTMQALRQYGVTFQNLLDNVCLLSRIWGVKKLPLVVSIDPDGFVERIATEVSSKTMNVSLSLEQSAKRTRIFEPARKGVVDTRTDTLLQNVTNLLSKGRRREALETLKTTYNLDPTNEIVAQQIAVLSQT
jgi:hypothetical protein